MEKISNFRLSFSGLILKVGSVSLLFSCVIFVVLTSQSNNNHNFADSFQFPLSNWDHYSSGGFGFGGYSNYFKSYHLGQDTKVDRTDVGTLVFTVANGRVVISDKFEGYGTDNEKCSDKTGIPYKGYAVVIEHQLSGGAYVTSLYGHLQEGHENYDEEKQTGLIPEGSEVKKGQYIGKIASYWHFTDSKSCSKVDWHHLHFAIRIGKFNGKDALYVKGYDKENWIDEYHTLHKFWENPNTFIKCHQGNFDSNEWYFNTDGDLECWKPFNVVTYQVKNGFFTIDPQGDDPYIESPLFSLNASDYSTLIINLSSKARDREGFIYFATEREPFYSNDKRIPFTVIGNADDDAYYINYIELGEHLKWVGTIIRLRIDPTNRGMPGTKADTVGFDFIRLININPTVSIPPPSSGPPGTPFILNWSGFVPNNTLTSYLKKPDGTTSSEPFDTDNQGNASHEINSSSFSPGTYEHWAVDNYTGKVSNTESFTVTAVAPNNPPDTPSTPTGPSIGLVGQSLSFSTSATDPDGDSIQYQFKWGDGNSSAWGDSIQSYSWRIPGTYEITALARDSFGETSLSWSSSHTITIIDSPPITATPRGWLGSAVLGNVIFTIGGGICSDCGQFGHGETSTVEVYDPSLNTWIEKSPLNSPRIHLTAAEVNGKIYTIGGTRGCCTQPVWAVEEYDPFSNTWVFKSNMLTARWKLTSSVVDGKIYAIGGGTTGNQCVPSGIVEEYDPSSDTWTLKSPMPTPRWGTANVVINGQIYVLGGSSKCPHGVVEPKASLEVYDPSTGNWIVSASMPTARWDLAAANVNGKIYAIGGWDPYSQSVLQTVEEYDPISNTWAEKSPMPTARTGLIAVVVDDQIYTFGGFDGENVTNIIEKYDPITDTWQRVTEGKTIYVNINNTSGIEDGSQTYPFTAIQAGLDAASDGDTVLVRSGIYFENIVINHGIKLVGEGARTTTIDGGGSGNVIVLININDAWIKGFTITGNRNNGYAGIWCEGSKPLIANNIIINNPDPAIRCNSGSDAVIQNNIFVNNEEGVVSNNSSPLIVNNTFYKNHMGISNYMYGIPIVTNNILANNYVGIYKGGHVPSPVLKNNNVWNSQYADYLDTDLGPGPTDISVDPLFVDPFNSDFHLQPESPCIDAGTPNGAPSTDIDGNPRDELPDIGAYEFKNLLLVFLRLRMR